jgi:hypothetical protein
VIDKFADNARRAADLHFPEVVQVCAAGRASLDNLCGAASLSAADSVV